MSELFQGLFACIIAGSFFALLMVPFINSGRHAAQERIDEDRRRVTGNELPVHVPPKAGVEAAV
jgi:hypothetical protein